MKPYPRNPRQITQGRAERLADTLERLGDLSGIVHELNTGQIAGGHQRLRVMFGENGGGTFKVADADIEYSTRYDKPDAQGTLAHGFLKWRGNLYAYRETRWTAEQLAEANIAANLGAGVWDWDMLANEWETSDLIAWGFDSEALQDWGAAYGGLTNMLASEQPEPVDVEPELDRAEELRIKWGVETGDLWQLGEHRVICGDCTDAAVVARVMGATADGRGEKADCIATDIPYEVTPKNWDVLPELNKFMDGIDKISTTNASFLTTSVNPLTAKIISLFYHRYKHSWIWNKKLAGNFLTAQHKPMMIHEDITVLCRGDLFYTPTMIKGMKRVKGGGGHSRLWEMEITSRVNDDYYPRSIIEIGNTDRTGILHPTEKPEPLYRYLLSMYSAKGQLVYDPFLGSGTTLIACENLSRKCRGVEIAPAYVAVTLERFATAFPSVEIKRIAQKDV